jgi:hypothetical protein
MHGAPIPAASYRFDGSETKTSQNAPKIYDTPFRRVPFVSPPSLRSVSIVSFVSAPRRSGIDRAVAASNSHILWADSKKLL